MADQFQRYPLYCYLEKGEIQYSPQKCEKKRTYEKLVGSQNTVLFWSSKSSLIGVQLIYMLEKGEVSFELAVSCEVEDGFFIQLCMEAAAAGLKYALKQEVRTVLTP